MTKFSGADFIMPQTLRFGNGALGTLVEQLNEMNFTKVGVISDKGIESAGIVEDLKELLEQTGKPYVIFTNIVGEPTFSLLESTIHFLRDNQCDLVIGIGGGSAMDVAKASAALADGSDLNEYLSGNKVIANRKITNILLPTTSGTGAEMTMNAIFADEKLHLKRGLVSQSLLPDIAIVDPELTLTCPPKVTASSGVDAFTHAIESYVAPKATLLTKLYARKAMELFPDHIFKAVFSGKDIAAREGMSWVSNLAGTSLANAGVGAVHALAYPLGGKFHIEHGIANALLLPYVFAITGRHCEGKIREIASFLQLNVCGKNALEELIKFMQNLLMELKLPSNLKELNIEQDALPLLASQAVKVDRLINNTPYILSESEILNIYKAAYEGF